VAYRVDVEEARKAMFDAFEELRDDPKIGPTILDDLQWFGVDQLADSAVILSARIKTLPGKQWEAGRAYNGIIKRIFDERGIEIPFPHRTIYLGEDKQGEVPLALRRARPAGATTSEQPPGRAAPSDRARPETASDDGLPLPDDSEDGDDQRS
jgi:small conductance mechanosensitive channel